MTVIDYERVPVCVRHVTARYRDPAGAWHPYTAAHAGAVPYLGSWLVAQDWTAINGDHGWFAGDYEVRLREDGSFNLRLPNSVGADGVLHRDRFLCRTDGNYHPGDEWLELYLSDRPEGDPVFVGTPIRPEVTSGQVQLSGYDAVALQKKYRTGLTEFYVNAPRDVFERATRATVPVVSDDFAAHPLTVSSGIEQTHGQWRYLQASSPAEGEPLTLFANSLAVPGTRDDAYLTALDGPTIGVDSSDRNQPWRFEADITLSAFPAADLGGDGLSAFGVGLIEPTGTNFLAAFSILIAPTGGASVQVVSHGDTVAPSIKTITDPPRGGDDRRFNLAMEFNGRHVFYYFDGELIAVRQMPNGGDEALVHLTAIAVTSAVGATAISIMTVHHVLFTRDAPHLMADTDPGDYHLPGALTSGGLRGRYYDEVENRNLALAEYRRQTLDPTREPAASVLTPQINFPAGAGWTPTELAGTEFFSARWSGAVHLDLVAADYRFRLLDVDDLARLWVGKTRFGEQAIEHWDTLGTGVSGYMRAHLNTLATGWYPIVLEYAEVQGLQALVLQYERSDNPGVWTTVPASMLSPYGCVDEHLRLEPLREVIGQTVTETFGYQWRCRPRRLESGVFPGEVIPRVREGRDTNEVVTEVEGSEYAYRSDADSVVDSLLADAAGIADPQQAAQLTEQVIAFGELGRHPSMQVDYESLAEISERAFLRQRLTSKQTLRSSPWEEMSVRPRGTRKWTDSFPVSGTFELLEWLPGDGVRRVLPTIGVEDRTPVQMTGQSWTFTRQGRGHPTVSFRARPRSRAEVIKRIQRAALSPQRNYQGQLAILTGNAAAHPARTDVTDHYSRVPFPVSLDRIVRAEVVVTAKADALASTIWMNETVVHSNVTRAGRYDVTAEVRRLVETVGTGNRMIARMEGALGCDYHLEVRVRV